MLTPVAKAYAAEKASVGMEEAMSALGGAGYMEENGFGRSIRDALVEKIWEGTVVVLALDLTRFARDPASVKAFVSWANSVIASCPSPLQQKLSPSLAIVKTAIEELPSCFSQPMKPLIPRPALLLVGAIASSVYLLEHAIWAHNTSEPTKELDVEVFQRWVREGGVEADIQAVSRAKADSGERVSLNSALVFGSREKSKL
ncbi:hypothetical protein NLJ89_g10346 [Agrocybe chaxingu]|uniref:Acyl-CoA dehydrogenase/oxidase C-terminal domain-containing protein n=1 Tax=Agrocybe chaxingu TaxID=84603 RepID=A0A9W8JYC0_9AGAR|nr:hypothetical protein NLJ89_g10346 [Agrocybe chaxingu]